MTSLRTARAESLPGRTAASTVPVGIVRARQADELGAGSDARQHVVEIDPVVAERARHDQAAGQLGGGRVRLERGLRHDHLVARDRASARDEERDDLVAAVAEDELGGREPERLGDGLARARARRRRGRDGCARPRGGSPRPRGGRAHRILVRGQPQRWAGPAPPRARRAGAARRTDRSPRGSGASGAASADGVYHRSVGPTGRRGLAKRGSERGPGPPLAAAHRPGIGCGP